MPLQSLALHEAARGESRAQGQVQKCGRSLYIIDHYKKVFGLRRNFVGNRKQIATIRSSTLSVDKKRQLGDECVAKLAGGDSEEAVKNFLQTRN